MNAPSLQDIILLLLIMALSSVAIWAVNAGQFVQGEKQEYNHKSAATGVKVFAAVILGIAVAIIAVPLFFKAKSTAESYSIEKKTTVTK
jgi:predicted ABC-type exoprotein transport system permease subunit